MNQVMKSFGSIGVLTDPDSLDDDPEPGSDLWGFKNMPQFEEYFNSGSQKLSMNSGRRGFKRRCLEMILDKSLKTSDCELVTWGTVHLWWKKRIYSHVQFRKILLTVDAGVILFVFNSIAREYSNFSRDILEVILLTLWFTLCSIAIELEGHCIPSLSLLLILTGTVWTLHTMPASEKEVTYDFGDPSRTDCEKWTLFSKELLHLLMNTHGTAWHSYWPMDYRRQREFSWW